MTSYEVPDGPKMLRETLCIAQSRVMSDPHNPRRAEHAARLQRLIDACDVHRPLGPDGKHGDRHTPTCGCEDKPAGNYGPGQPRPRGMLMDGYRAIPHACPDQYASPHGAGTRPGGCATCAGVSDGTITRDSTGAVTVTGAEQSPATGSHPTSGSGVQPVGVGQPVGIRPAVPQTVGTGQAAASDCHVIGDMCATHRRHKSRCEQPVVTSQPVADESRPDWWTPEYEAAALAGVADGIAARQAQCPRCTSHRRDFRFAITDGGTDASYCADRWHDHPGQ